MAGCHVISGEVIVIMIQIELRLSESLLSILRDTENPKTEIRHLEVARGATLREILATEGISPLLVPMATIDNQRVDLDIAIERETTITLIGPLAGG